MDKQQLVTQNNQVAQDPNAGCNLNFEARPARCEPEQPVMHVGLSCLEEEEAPKTQSQKEAEETAKRLGITVKRLLAARAYAATLVKISKARGEKIKESTVRSKVAKKFKIQLT